MTGKLTLKNWSSSCLKQKDTSNYNLQLKFQVLPGRNLKTIRFYWKRIAQTYSKPCQTSEMKRFARTVNGKEHLSILAKHSTLDCTQTVNSFLTAYYIAYER